jgi:hypothetical protein
MADTDIDKFVLRYEVDSNKAVERLRALDKAVEGVHSGANHAGKEFKKLGSAITTELGNVAPAANAVKAVIGEITAGFGAAGIAAAGFGAAALGALKLGLAAREQLNAQRLSSRDAGIGMLRMEDLQHKLVGGNVSRGTVADSLKATQDFLRRAYSDPSRSGPENRTMAMLGIRQGASPLSNLSFNQQLASRWHGMDPAQVQAEASMIGMNKDYALSIGKQGAALSTVSMNSDEIKERQAAIENTAKFNTELAKFNEEMTKLTTTVGAFVLGPLANLIEGVNKSIAYASKEHAPTGPGEGQIPVADGDWTGGEGLASALRGPDKSGSKITQDVNETARLQREAAKAAEAKAVEDKKAAQKAVEADDNSNDELNSIISQFQLAINAFSDSVSAFSGITSDRQAWAAWAGEVGRASGLGTGNNPSLGVPGDNRGGGFTYSGANASAALTGGGSVGSANRNNPGNIEYGAFAKAHGATGADGRFAIFPDMSTGTAAQSALLQSYRKDGKDTISAIVSKWAPSNENDTKGYIDFVAKRTGIGANQKLTDADYEAVRAAMAVREGASGSGVGAPLTGPLANAWDQKAKPVYGFTGNPNAVSPRGGWSKDKIQLRGVASSTAAGLGVPLQQLMMGGVPRSDIEWSLSNRLATLLKQEASIQAAMHAPIANPAARSKLMTDLKTNELSISNIRAVGAQVAAMGSAGDRQYSLGVTQPVTININGATDPQATAEAIDRHLNRAFRNVANSSITSQIK